MQAVKIKLYQNMVNYRREMSFGYVQSYPLPTPSMIRGMAHALLDLKEYKPLKISIQGNFSTVVTNMQKIIKFDRDPKSRPANPYHVTVGNSQKTATTGVMFVDSIVDMELLLHIAFEEENLNQKLLEALILKPVVLGRNEDFANLDFRYLKIVDIETSDEYKDLDYNIYLNTAFCKKEQLSGTSYRLPFYYQAISSFEDKRIFQFTDAVYIAKGSSISEHEYLIDEDNDLVSFLEASGEK